MSAIFRTTSQAIHFSFIIQAYEASPDSPMSAAIRRFMMENGIWRDKPSTVSFGGLSQLEVRAQCAMIRAIVSDQLPGPEAWAIQARYGLNEIVLENGDRRPVFSRERYEAIMNLGNWFAPSFGDMSQLVVDLLVARAVDSRVAKITYRQIEERFGVNKDRSNRAVGRMRTQICALEEMGLNRLEPAFIRDGLVETL